MNQRTYAKGVAAVAILLLAALGVETVWGVVGGDKDPHMPVPEEFAQQITVHEDGDFVYSYALDDVSIDEEERVLYVPNLVNVFTEHTFSKREKEKLAEKIGGTVVTDLCGQINFFQLHVDGGTYGELEEMAQSLREMDGVMDASYEVPLLMEPDGADSNPWSISGEEPDRGNEASPGGKDWWAEAIGAYTAWSYEQWFHDVAVGVIDSGFYTQHEDLGDNTTMVMLPSYSENSFYYHGTAVAGIIGAADNEIGLRGVASSQNHQLTVYCADWSPVTNDSESEDYVSLLGTGDLSKMMKDMLDYDVKVINNSWGMADTSYTRFVTEKLKEWITDDDEAPFADQSLQETADMLAQAAYDTSRSAIDITLQMIASGKEFLIVQSAGNGVDNGGYPTAVDQTGYFRGITKELFEQIHPGGYMGIDYTNLNYHILVAGAVANQRTDDGAYIMTSTSNYGPEVDLCAPGLSIFTTYDSTYENPAFTSKEDEYQPTDKYFPSFSGTSAAAPMVTGAAALLWSIDPDLTAREVSDLLVNHNEVMAEGTKNNGHPFMGSEGTYPMLNIGAAVRALMEEKSEGLVSEIRITDLETGEPVEGAEVIYCHGFFDGVQSEVSDSDGHCTIRGADDLRPYPAETTVLVKAEGQLRWWGTVQAWLEDDTAQTVNEIELDMNNVLDMTGDLLEQLKEDLPALWEYIQTVMEEAGTDSDTGLEDKLAQLAGQYGVIPLGEEVYSEVTGYGGGEELVDPARLTGLLGADIFDYDGDGQEELLTVRLETGAGSDAGWGETRCFLTVYEWDGAANQAVLADEQSFRFSALTNSLTNSALHLARGTFDSGEPGLYLTYSWEMNDCVFGVVRISYDGVLEVTGGVECHDYHGAFYCYDAVGNGAISALCQSGSVDSDGWTLLESYEFEGSDVPEQSRVNEYRNCYMNELEDIGLIEPGLPGRWLSPDRPQGNDLESIKEASQFDRASIVRKPADRYIVSDGQLTTLCGLWHLSSTALLEEDMTLSVYDEGDWR